MQLWKSLFLFLVFFHTGCDPFNWHPFNRHARARAAEGEMMQCIGKCKTKHASNPERVDECISYHCRSSDPHGPTPNDLNVQVNVNVKNAK